MLSQVLACLIPLGVSQARADEPLMGSAPPSASAPAADAQKRMSIDHLKKQYWTQGGDVEVVQNRIYSKAHRLELGVYGGFLSSDPFLSVKNLGISTGYYFNEYLGLRGLAWRAFSARSSALEFLESQTFSGGAKVTANTNPPSSYLGGELAASLVYGKLSLLGKVILYYDLMLSAGGGITATETGNDFTQSLGIGQQIYLTHGLSVRADYRLMRYNEDIKQKQPGAGFGAITGARTNYTSGFFVGLNLLL
jgi:outer membrane beta-barrel protein